MDSVLELLNNIPTGTYEAIGAALGISVLLQGIKKWLSIQSDKVVAFLLSGLSFITVAIDYLMQAVHTNPSILGQQSVTIVGLSTILYRFMIKPASTLVADAKEYRLSKARLANEAVENQDLLVDLVAPVASQPEPIEPVKPDDF